MADWGGFCPTGVSGAWSVSAPGVASVSGAGVLACGAPGGGGGVLCGVAVGDPPPGVGGGVGGTLGGGVGGTLGGGVISPSGGRGTAVSASPLC